MAEVRVKKGQEHFAMEKGVLRQYGAGATMQVPDESLKAFMRNVGDKFDVVGAEGIEIEGTEEETEEDSLSELKDADRETLLAAAKDLDLKVDPKWNLKKLRKEVEKALKG